MTETTRGDTALNERWLAWLRENVDNGADFRAAYHVLREAGFSDKAIARAVDVVRPPDSALADGTLPTPPLIARAPANLRRLDERIELYALDGFLDARECADLMAIVSDHLAPSPVASDGSDYGFRTSRTCQFSPLRNPLAAAVDAKICTTFGYRASYGEGIQAQWYDVGQQFKAHTDFFPPGTRVYLRFAGVRGNRTWTFMVYLNDGMQGGGTRFPDLGLTVQPRAGMALLWNNLFPNGTPNPATQHAGEPVTAGHKVVITKWFRVQGSGALLV